MKTRFLSARQANGIKYVSFISLLLFVIGCSGHGMTASQLRSKSIESFNLGKEVEAASLAKKIAKVNESESNLLLAQYIIYNTVEYNYNLNRINNKWYEGMVKVNLSQVDPSLRDGYIAAKAFSEMHLKSADDGLDLLKDECKRWIAADVKSCLGKIVSDVQASYVSSPSRIGALFLIESVEVGHELKLIDQKSYHYNSGLAFAAIDKRRSLVMLRYLMGSDPLNDDVKKTYCSILNMDFFNSAGQSLLGQVTNLKDYQISATCQ